MRSHIHYDFMKCTEFMLALDVQQLVFRAKHRARKVMQKNHMKSNVQKPHTNHRMHAWCVALNAIKIILFKCWNHFSSPRAHFSLTCFAVSHLRTYFRVAVVHFVVSFCKLSFTYLLFFFLRCFMNEMAYCIQMAQRCCLSLKNQPHSRAGERGNLLTVLNNSFVRSTRTLFAFFSAFRELCALCTLHQTLQFSLLFTRKSFSSLHSCLVLRIIW